MEMEKMEFIKVRSRGDAPFPSLLVFPAMSLGNVGQLAVDLLICSGMPATTKAGYLDDLYVLPCVGNDPFGPVANGTLAVALEVYEDPKSGIALVQQRSPVVRGKMVEYAEHVADWAARSGFKEVVVLSGMDSAKRPRRDMMGPEIHYISSANPDGSDEICNQLGWKRLEQAGQILQHEITRAEAGSSRVVLTDENYYAGLPFAALYSACKAKAVKVVCLLLYCSEGDNIPDAFFMAESFHKLLQKKQGGSPGGPIQWRIPLSWETVYGPPPDDSIY